ncbi:unnamed protein product [Rotaria sp. Silwood2]|nr:unnamed protein product [Rotaria sp. Silwood2]CAF2838807.1 unnamed protein product [Rotaria sp. Silwood2]CAF3119527.1 unnamed protein product [Rotaria sp. Silwood2]CAF3246031.1 unnamed protein product [Rotaria sp. Silwood2]CAF4123665.1 unnamed protein product [Rotaria sp. Silwood2]
MVIRINRLFLTINCKVLDTMIRILLATNDWLNGFSFALVLSVLRRLIISSVSICISPWHSWLFHFAYLVSFLPSMKTFIVDVLPSKLYKDKFGIVVTQTIRQYRGIL